jgi:hypothetical protein
LYYVSLKAVSSHPLGNGTLPFAFYARIYTQNRHTLFIRTHLVGSV